VVERNMVFEGYLLALVVRDILAVGHIGSMR